MMIGLGAQATQPTVSWTPGALGTERFVWLRADDADLTLSGSKVTAWADHGGTGSYAQATDAKRPSKVAGSNGYNGIQFAGSMLLTRTGLTVTSGDLLFVSAVNVPATSVNSYLYGTATRVIADTDGNAGTQVGYYDGTWRKAGAAQTGLQILAWDMRAAGANIYRNGTVLSGGPLTYTPFGLTDPAIGFDSSLGTKSIVMELVGVRTESLSATVVDAIRSRLEKYMGARYGLAVA